MDLIEYYTTISEQMCLNFNNKKYFLIRDLKIEDIVCDLHFTYSKYDEINTEKIKCSFFNDNISNWDGDCIPLLQFEISQEINKHPLHEFCSLTLQNLIEYISGVKFDTLIGRFIPTNSQQHSHLRTSKLQLATRNLFKSIGLDIEDNSEECVICYERTFCKTTCNHHLCFKCVAQIKPSTPNNSDDDDEGSVEEVVCCPMCRSVVLYSKIGGCGCH